MEKQMRTHYYADSLKAELEAEEFEHQVWKEFANEFLPESAHRFTADNIKELRGTPLGDHLLEAFDDYMWEARNP
jgi:hypothetical protein